jgi:hypothetical protein
VDNFPEVITRLAGMAGRFATTLDCADISFLADGTLDELPLPSRPGAIRVGGIDLNKPRIRAALAAALALTPAPHGFTVAEHAARVGGIVIRLRVGPGCEDVLLMRLPGLVSRRRRRTSVSNGSGVSRGDRNRNARPGPAS